MAKFNLDDFKGKVFKKDLARANRFEIQIVPPPILGGNQGLSRTITLLAEDVMLPGIMVGTRPFRFNNLNEQRAHLIDYMGDSVTFTFLCDTEWSIRNFLEEWIQKMIDPSNRYVQYPEEYYSTIEITSLDKGDNELTGWKLEDAFPRSLAPAQFSSGSPDPVRQPCTFSFTKWQRYTPESPTGRPEEPTVPTIPV